MQVTSKKLIKKRKKKRQHVKSQKEIQNKNERKDG